MFSWNWSDEENIEHIKNLEIDKLKDDMEKVINNRDEILNLYEELTENNQKLIEVEEIRTKLMKIGRKRDRAYYQQKLHRNG